LTRTRVEGSAIPDAPFWPGHLGFWLGYLAIVYLALLPVSPLPPGELLLNKAIWAASGVMVSLPLRAFYRRSLPGSRPGSLALVVVTACVGTAGIWLAGFSTVSALHAGGDRPTVAAVAGMYVALVIALLAWSAVYVSSLLWRTAAADRLARTEAERQLREAQLAALRQPLQPHFLFNALASVRALVTEDPVRAREAIGVLAELLRDSLHDGASDFVTVAREVESVSRYLALESMRFEHRLATHVRVDPAAAGHLVPAFAIRLLVENAVKHGHAPKGQPLEVGLRIGLESTGALEVRVENSGSLAAGTATAHGIGLLNLRERLVRLFPRRHSLALEENDGKVVATLVLAAEGVR